MSKAVKKILTLCSIIIFFISSTLGITLAWFGSINNNADPYVSKGSVIRQYFHTGAGTSTNPFVITRPIHYYHLVELYQRKESFSSADYYFQLGYDLDGDGKLEVYSYDYYGATDETYSDSLNMAYYSGALALLPVGTSETPFNGTFDGSGLTIENLNVCAMETTDDTYYTADIGAFGFLGENAIVKDLYFDNLTIDITDLNVEILNDQTNDHNDSFHETINGKVGYVGYIAGHVNYSTTVENVYINNATILGGAIVNAISSFGYFGAVESSTGQLITSLGEQVEELRTSGSDIGWGNTLNMSELYSRLYQVARTKTGSSSPSYATAETIVQQEVDQDENGDPIYKVIYKYVTDTSSSISSNNYDLRLRAYQSELGGSYSYNIANGYNPWIYLTGYTEYQRKTVTTYTLTVDKNKTAYYISDKTGKYFLSVATDLSITSKGSSEATKWTVENVTSNTYKLKTYVGVNSQDVDVFYYLTYNGSTLSVVSDASNATVWETNINSNNEIRFLETGTTNYLLYDDVWKIASIDPSSNISDGNGHYITISNNQISSCENEGLATDFYITSDSSGMMFRTIINNNSYYLAFGENNGLILSSQPFHWAASPSYVEQETNIQTLSCNDSANRTWYLVYSGGWNVALKTGNTISYNKEGTSTYYYLGVSNFFDRIATSTNTTAPASYTPKYLELWQMNTTTSTTTIEMRYNGKLYYLGANIATGELIISQDMTEWIKDDNGDYYIGSSDKAYYLTYKDGWRVEASSKYRLKGSSGYIRITTDSNNNYIIGNTSKSSNAAVWTIENDSGSGYVYTELEGTLYYLSATDTGLGLCLKTNIEELKDGDNIISKGATIWSYSSSLGFSTVIDDVNYYVSYDGGWKLSRIAVTIKNGSNYLGYATDDDGATYYVTNYTSTSSSTTYWYKSDNQIWMVKNGVNWYLTYVGENKTPSLTTNGTKSKTKWNLYRDTNDTDYIYYGSDKNYYLDWYYDNSNNIVWMTRYKANYYFKTSSSTYLSVSDSGELTTSTSIRNYLAQWRIGSGKVYALTSNGTRYYLALDPNSENGFTIVNSDNATIFTSQSKAFGTSRTALYATVGDYSTKRYVMSDGSSQVVEYYTFEYDGNYMILNSSNQIENTTNFVEGERTKWQLDSTVAESTSGTTYIYMSIGTSIYYLHYNGTNLYVDTTKGDTWIKDSNGYYYTGYTGNYLSFSVVNNKWGCKPDTLSTFITGGHALSISNVSGTITVTDNGTVSKWVHTSGGAVYAIMDGTKYYLTVNNGSLSLSIGADPGINWAFSSNPNWLTTSINTIDYYLIYNSGWKLGTSLYYTIKSGTNYMTVSNNTIGVGTESVAEKWGYDSTNKALYTISSSKYLNWDSVNGFSLGASYDSDVKFTIQNGTVTNITVTYNSNTYNVVYDSTGWNIVRSGLSIQNNGKYYNVTSSMTFSPSTTIITTWYMTGSNTSPGNIYTFINGKLRYWSVNSSSQLLELSTASQTIKCEVESSVNYYYAEINSTKYYIYIDGTTCYAKPSDSFYISAVSKKDSTTNYMYDDTSATNSIMKCSTSKKTVFYFDSEKHIYFYRSSTIQYLYQTSFSTTISNGNELKYSTSSTNAFKWSFTSDNKLKGECTASKTTYVAYLGLYHSSSPAYRVFVSGNSNISSTSTQSAITFTYIRPSAVKGMTIASQTATNTLSLQGQGTDLSSVPKYNKTTTNEYTNTSNLKKYYGFKDDTTTLSTAIINRATLGSSYKSVSYSSKKGSNATGVAVTDGDIEGLTYSFKTLNDPTVTISKKEKEPTIKQTQTYGDTLSSPTVTSNVKSGIATYIPIKLALQDENDSTSYYSDYRVNETRNTGYIVSGSNQTSGYYRSDIRVSNYDTSDIYKAFGTGASGTPTYNSTYDSRLQVLTKTAYSAKQADNNAYSSDSSSAGKAGYVRIKDSHNSSNISKYYSSYPSTAVSYSTLGLTKYSSTEDGGLSREQFANTLMGGNDVYGLHFMESTISLSNTIIADRVSILGKTYYNYELPESCIDFNVYERGAVNFFAGTYYSSTVDAFFSLHQIFRDSKNQTIIAIKEIDKIYQDKTNGSKKKYIYKYVGESVTVPSNYELVFDLSWITNPTGIIQNALYYFEIPLNKGEYALGSVNNKVGAYLLYLDIATNGGGSSLNTIIAEGSSITNKINVDTRSMPDTTLYSYLKFAITCPENTSLDDFAFSVKISFSDTNTTSNYSEGLYTIEIVNKSSAEIRIDIVLYDNDDDPQNEYPYAYQIIYTNEDVERQIVQRVINADTVDEERLDYWKVAASINLPSTGDASESAYD